jgi:prolipoprotein diacylglyceryltransferase
MFVLYGIMRFTLEAIRDDNPFETAGLTIAQILSIGLFLLGVVLVVVFARIKPERLPAPSK